MISAQITEAQRLAPKWDVAHPVHEPPFPLNRTLKIDSLSDSLRLSIGASNAYQLTYLTSMKTGFE